MDVLINTSSLIGLFLIAIVSSTILPGPSDAAVLGSLALGFAPLEIIIIASLGGVVGRAINYYMGSLGETYIVHKKKWLKEKVAICPMMCLHLCS